MWQNEKSHSYSIKTASTALLVLLAIYVAIDLIEVGITLSTGQMVNMNTAIVVRLFADIPVILLAVLAANPVKALRFKAPGVKNVVYTLLLAFFAYLALSVVLQMVAQAIVASGKQLPENLVDMAVQQIPFVLNFLLFCVFAPLTEEILFRGMLQNAYERRFGFWAFVLSGLLFGWMHAEPLSMLNGAVIGLLLGYLYMKTRSIWVPILFHAFYNLMAFTSVLDAYVVTLPWTLGLQPASSMNLGNSNYVIYSLGILAVGVLMSYAMLRMLQRSNPKIVSTKSPVYFAEPGATPVVIIALVLLAVRSATGILLYVMQ